jgi:hypothetical protein
VNFWLVIVGCGLILPAFLVRMTILAAERAGTLFYYANIASDTFWKRTGLPRELPDLLLLGFGLICL